MIVELVCLYWTVNAFSTDGASFVTCHDALAVKCVGADRGEVGAWIQADGAIGCLDRGVVADRVDRFPLDDRASKLSRSESPLIGQDFEFLPSVSWIVDFLQAMEDDLKQRDVVVENGRFGQTPWVVAPDRELAVEHFAGNPVDRFLLGSGIRRC